MAQDEIEFTQLLTRVLNTIEKMQAEVEQKKRFANELCIEYGQPPRFNEVDETRNFSTGIRRDQFFGRPMATAIKEYLQTRGPSDKGGLGAASVNEIYSALVMGGYRFDTKNELNAKRGLREALSKNTVTFTRVGDSYGLFEWYPKPPKDPNKAALKKQARRASKKSKQKTETAASAKPTAASSELRKPRAAPQRKHGSQPKTPERKEKPHVEHEPDKNGPVTGQKAA